MIFILKFPALPRLPLRRPRRRGLPTPSTAMADTALDMALALSLMPDSDTAPDITPPTLGPLPPSLPQLRPKPRRPPQRRRKRDPLMPTTATEPDTVLATDTEVTPDTVAFTAMVATPMVAFMADMDSQSLPLPLPRKRRLRRRRRGPLMPTTATEPDTASATEVTDTAFPMPDMGMESDLTTLPQSSPLPRRRRLPPRNKQTAIKSNESRWTAQQKYAYNQNPSSFSLALWSILF